MVDRRAYVAVVNMDKRSPIWKFVVICESDESKALCSLCKTVILRGAATAKDYTTSRSVRLAKNDFGSVFVLHA